MPKFGECSEGVHYYYDVKLNICKNFLYDCDDQGSNFFDALEECQKLCVVQDEEIVYDDSDLGEIPEKTEEGMKENNFCIYNY